MGRYCVCGKGIDSRFVFCKDCLEKYGRDRKEYPEWLLDWIRSMDREYKAESRHYELEYFEEYHYPISDEAAHNLKKAKRNPNMEFEDFVWRNQ